MTFNAYIDTLIRDPLHVAREVAKQQRVIGYVDAASPVELIIAADALPVRLRPISNASTNTATPHADQYLERAFHPEVRAIAEQFLTGQLDFLDAIIFPRSNDSAQRLYYYICELQRAKRCAGPKPLLHDVATIARDTSEQHTLESLKQLASALGCRIAKLAHAIERMKARMSVLAKIDALRANDPGFKGAIAQRILRAAEFDWRETFDAACLQLPPTLTGPVHRTRILLCGSAPPDSRLHEAVESANGSVVAEFTETQSAPYNGIDGDEFSQLAHRYHRTATPARQMSSSPTYLSKHAAAAKADGVILWLIEEDEALPWELAAQERALKAANVPVLTLTRQEWLAPAATLDAIHRFVTAVKATR